MRFFIVLFLLVSPFLKNFAQGISITPDGSPPDSSAILDIQSTTKGLLIPRMTLEERDAILMPVLGLTVFQTDDVQGFYFYDGSSWVPVTRPATDINWTISGGDMYNNNEGNIGIGTSTPSGKMHISSSSDTTQLIIDASINQTNTHPFIKFRRSDGVELMWINSDHQSNTFMGYGSGRLNNSHSGAATNNTFIGSYAGYSNTVGYGNTANGVAALSGNTLGYNNTATGLWALSSNTTACQNTAVGYDALFSQTYSNNNMTWNSDNVAIGYAALTSNAPTSTINGISNTAVGSYALTANTIGYDNTGIGTSALYTNTTGHENTALGRQSLFYNTIGEENTAGGYKSLRNNSTGSGNTAFGNYSLTNSLGSFNTAVGYHALENNLTGSQNSCIGSYSNTSMDYLGNATAIGTFAVVNASEKVRLGSSDVTVIEGQVAYSWPSDGRFKENIQHDVKGLDFILKLEPVSYNFNRLTYARHIHETITKDREAKLIDQSKNRSVGFIAQDVEKIIHQTGFTSFDAIHAPVNETDNYSMGYAEFVVPLVKAVQELNEKLISENEMLIKRIVKLELLIAEKDKN
ncbi:MAG TPA: tail fiber domain-containing protein [Saprospiraceae bacterium]|nr:tail fiber domain-containing protein [Saprospiraceae bacterium]